MPKDKKDALAIVIGGAGKDDGGGDDKTDAMSDFLAAVKADDPKGMSMAMERHYELCSMGGDEESEDEDDEEPAGESARY